MKQKTQPQVEHGMVVSIPSQIATAAPIDGAELIISKPISKEAMLDMFLAEQDIRESSKAIYKRTISIFFQWMDTQGIWLEIAELSDLNRYKSDLLARGLSKLSVCSYLASLRKFYSWGSEHGWLRDIARHIKTPKRKEAYRRQHLSVEKSTEILKYFSTGRKRRAKSERTPIQHRPKKSVSPEAQARDFAIVNLLLRGGLRTIEVVRANIGDITFRRDRRILKVWGKGRDDREDDFIVLSDKTYEPIKKYLETYRKGAKTGEPLFTSVSTQNLGQRLTTRTISGICKEGLKRVGLDGKEYTPHSFRHTTAVAILKTGGSINEVQAVLRHRSIDTSRIYTKSIEEEMRLEAPTEYTLDKYFQY